VGLFSVRTFFFFETQNPGPIPAGNAWGQEAGVQVPWGKLEITENFGPKFTPGRWRLLFAAQQPQYLWPGVGKEVAFSFLALLALLNLYS
jgi:hypothetical protein